MKNIFYFLFSLLFLSSFLKANPVTLSSELKDKLPTELEDEIQSTIDKNKDKSYGLVWVCYSRYVGPVGYGFYNGWSFTQGAAFNNAMAVCMNNHRYAPQYCLVTGCFYRYW